MNEQNGMKPQKEIIVRLKNVRDERGYSIKDMMSIIEDNGDYVSESTLRRLFKDNSEYDSFNYESTIRPVAKAILDMETIKDTDDMDTQALKALLEYKIQRIEELETQANALQSALDKEKLKYHEKLDAEREQYSKRIAFLMEQISLKDKRMDYLLDAVFQKDKQQKELMDRVMKCQRCVHVLEKENS
jgi:vacuolar-type H+-ATPase subunit I/STV1